MSQKSIDTVKSYQLTHVDSTEEMILNEEFPNRGEPARGWRRFRINYRNEQGFSNIEGTLYFPPNVDPYPILDDLEERIRKETIPPAKES